MRPALVLALIFAVSACGARTDLLVDSAGVSPQPASTSTGGNTAFGSAVGTGIATSTLMAVSPPTTDTATDTDIHSAILPVDSGTPSCVISASNYDRSCTVDTECTPIATGNFCAPPDDTFYCLYSISVAGLAQYNADVAETELGSRAFIRSECADMSACCREGQCTTTCQSSSDTLPECASAGGSCVFGDSCPFSGLGPPSSCVYTDQVCCIPIP